MTVLKRGWGDDSDIERNFFTGARALIISRRAQFVLFLYVLFPLFAGFISAMQASGRTSGWPLGFRIAYYLPLALVVMWTSGLVCTLLAKPARALKMPLWLLLIGGVLLAGELIKAYVRFVVPIFDKLLPPGATGGRVVEFTLLGNIQAGVPTIVTWLLLNLLAWKVFGIERFGYAAPTGIVSSKWSRRSSSEDMEIRPPNFISRARLGSIDSVEAIEAQQHYITLHMSSGARTILYRFGDALAELQGDEGIQVHRSWWVNKSRVEKLVRNGDRMSLVLANGREVPVSRTFALQVKEHFG